ncbi:MAG: DUF262 domain-containing protein [Patescibacteria group bacterium]
MKTQKIKIESDYKLPTLIQNVKSGALRIPAFQRKFIWEVSKIIKLLDSIYLDYPIGSFFLWTAEQEYYNFYRDIPELNLPKPSKYDKLAFVLDGQQRIISLYVTAMGIKLDKKDYKNICFDLDAKIQKDNDVKYFVEKKPDNIRYISVSDLLSDLADEELEIYNNLTGERKRAFNDCRQKFYNYPFSAVSVCEKELDEVCEIFERLNQGGKRLNLFDLVSAGTWSKDFDLRKAVETNNKKLEGDQNFGKIDDEVYTQTLALVSRKSCTRVVQLQLNKADIQNHWQDVIRTIGQAVDYLRHNLGVVNSLFLPYRSMVSLVAYLFYKIQENKQRSLTDFQSKQLDLWFWKAAFSERYTASTLTLMTEDRKLFDKIAEEIEVKINFPVQLDIEALIKIRMYGKSAIKNGVLCLLATKHPRHFKNNNPLTLDDKYYSDFNKLERHHIFPRAFIENKYGKAMTHSLPNFCFLPAELNNEISKTKPSKYFDQYLKSNSDFEDTLKTHLVKYDDSIKRDDYNSFLGSRAKLILDEIEKLTGSNATPVITGDDSKILEKTETKLRDLLDRKLFEKDPDYWKGEKRIIPSDIVGNIRKKINEALSKNPPKNLTDLTSREMMDFCDLMDYPKIILANWHDFYIDFRSKTDVINRFINLKEYRNAVIHNRELMPYMKKEGEAALEWLSLILSAKTKQSGDPFAVLFNKLPPVSKELYLELRKNILALDKNISEIHFRCGVSFRTKGQTFTSVSPRMSQIRIYLRYKGKLEDPQNITRSVKGIGTVFAAERDFKISTKDEILYSISLIKQSYEQSKNS